MQNGKSTDTPRAFESLKWAEDTPIVYVAFSKHWFYLRAHVSAYVLAQGRTPISPFMNFDYNLGDLIDRDAIRVANNTLLTKADELWVFGPVSDGVLVEVYLARQAGKPVRYFTQKPDRSFVELEPEDVRLEDVSDWLWERVQAGQDISRWHPRLRFHKTYPLVYPAYSKRNFFWQMHISLFCLEQRVVPLNPFMLFRYFLGDGVPRETVYRANNAIVRLSDAVWTFGEIADGVLAEVRHKREHGGAVRHYAITQTNPVKFRLTSGQHIPFEEPELERYREWLVTSATD